MAEHVIPSPPEGGWHRRSCGFRVRVTAGLSENVQALRCLPGGLVAVYPYQRGTDPPAT
jgi:hypothetical protein